VQDGKKLGKKFQEKMKNFLTQYFVFYSDDVKKRYEQKAAIEKQKYEQRLAEYKKSGGGVASSSPAKGKGPSKAPAKKSPKKPVGKKAAAKSKSSEEDNDDDDDDEDDDEE